VRHIVGTFAYHGSVFAFDPPISSDTKVQFQPTPATLFDGGVNIPITILPTKTNNAENEPSLQANVYAHLDTGAKTTVIDQKLAKILNLKPIGKSEVRTAGGNLIVPYYVVDLSFTNMSLSSVKRLLVAACPLGFNPKITHDDPHNFAILIGRDIMTRWNIVWNGPTSTVLISD